MNISLYPYIKETKRSQDIPLELFLDRIKSGYWQDHVLAVHRTRTDEEKSEAKKQVPYVTISGKFSERNENGLLVHSGFIAIDVDDVDNVNEVKSVICGDRYIYSCFTSISGKGLCLLFRVNPEKHREAFYGIAEYLLSNYRIVCDSLPDISRPRFVSWDPDIYLNTGAEKFAKYPKKEPKGINKVPEIVFVQSDFDEIVQEIVSRRLDITGDYRQWLKCCFAIVDKFGQSGRDYFHQVSQFSAVYDFEVAERQYKNCLKADKSGVTIASFYYLAKAAGIRTASAQTKTVSQYAALGKKARIAKEDVVKQLRDTENIPTEASKDIVNQIYDSNIQIDTADSPVDALEVWLRQNYDLRRNSITRYIENRGKPMEERDFNSIYIAGVKLFGKLSRPIFDCLVYSDFTPDYNPLIEFLEAYQDRQPSGQIAALFDTIQTDTGMGEGEFCPDYAIRFGMKWVVGIIASIFGEHSPLMLVLSGHEQNTGKTQWFRRLLPEPIRKYYAESKLDAGKDDDILMTQKLIIMDDEMGGKSKKESANLKDKTSKEVFSLREPYGRGNVDLRRLAVLCGTTNDSEILNDPTGNRRIIPIKVLSIDHSAYNAIDKTDVLIEALHLYRAGFSHHLNKDDIKMLADNTTDFVESAAEADLLNRYFEVPERQDAGGNVLFLTGSEIKAEIEKRTLQKLNHKRLGMELRRAGWATKTRKRNGMAIKGYWVIIRETPG